MSKERFIRIWTTAKVCSRTDQLDDAMALQLLQSQYGDEDGTKHFISLATGRAKCASVGPSMIEFRGEPIIP